MLVITTGCDTSAAAASPRGSCRLVTSPTPFVLPDCCQVPVRFSPTTSLPKSCRLVLMSRRDGGSASAATLVFMLKGQVDGRAPLKQVAVQSPLYQLGVSEFSVTNPFPAGNLCALKQTLAS